MKKLINNLFIAALFVIVLSCSSQQDEMILGTWRFENIEEQITNNDKPTMTQADIDGMKANSSYIFNRNKTYIMNLGVKNEGQWYISENGSALNMRSEVDNSVGRATIRELTDKKLVLIIQMAPGHNQILTLYKAPK